MRPAAMARFAQEESVRRAVLQGRSFVVSPAVPRPAVANQEVKFALMQATIQPIAAVKVAIQENSAAEVRSVSKESAK